MGKKTYRFFEAIAIAACLCLSLYAVYARLFAADPLSSWFPGIPIAWIAAGLAIVAIMAICLRHDDVATPPDYGREVSGAPKPARNVPSALAAIVLFGFIFPVRFYLGHIMLSHDRLIWLDRYAAIALPVVLAGAVLLWLYDTFFGKLLDGTATGKSPVIQRVKFAAKRIAVTLLLATGLILTHALHWQRDTLAVYRTVTTEYVLAMLMALLTSFMAISRRPARGKSIHALLWY